MASIGPSLPPHLLAKRKREEEEETTAATAKVTQPSTANSPDRSPDGSEKRRRVIGPSPPPAPIDELPGHSAHSSDDSESSDDDYGPAIPTEDELKKHVDEDVGSSYQQQRSAPKEEAPVKRDDWMMMPPSADGLARHMDPSRRPRQFKSGKGASSGVSDGMDSTWTETPEEKRKRLENQVLGVAPPPSSKLASENAKSKKDEESARRIKEYNEKHRGKSLLEQHKETTSRGEDDDPSKRAFDREKDIGGVLISKSKQQEMMKRAADFNSKFAGGKYL
ncbi:uncharacterized protein PV09_04770 [Verruconis gallopava]|uniref:DUF3752 domain-containing protein n=1 Tax=Verruconis gallopava TaxID=253628 RepID=A0A0D2ABL0_9PEZI|nr:uncharacterized protein PV09_04770 [Verruconis gallopava]KIW03930.1 hypothetical protein PV09_04770 [Verruconis gallopava]